MPFIRRYRLRKPLYRRRRMAARRLPLYAPMSTRRRFVSSSPTFTETYRWSTLYQDPSSATSTGIVKVKFDDLPQYTSYQELYNQYCIKRVTLTFVPSYNVHDSANQPTNPSAITAPRLVYAINDSAMQPIPASETDVLTDNGCKIRMLNRPVRVTFRPVAEVGVSSSQGGFVSESKRLRWLQTSLPGQSVLHSGVAFAITQTLANTSASDPLCVVYAKVTIGLRDPK